MTKEHKEQGHRDRELRGGWSIKSVSTADKKMSEIGAAATDTSDPVHEAGQSSPQSTQVSNFALIVMGVFGGLYLLYTWGWLEVAKAYSVFNEQSAQAGGTLGTFLQVTLFWIAPAAPAVWFIASLLSGGTKSGIRLVVSLLTGAIILLPFPLIFAGVSL